MSVQSSSPTYNVAPQFGQMSIKQRLSRSLGKSDGAPGGDKPPTGSGKDVFETHKRDRVSPATSYESLTDIPVFDDNGQPTLLGPHNLPTGAKAGTPNVVRKDDGKVYHRFMIPKKSPSVPSKPSEEIEIAYIPGVMSRESVNPEFRFHPGSVIDSSSSTRSPRPSQDQTQQPEQKK